MIFSNLAVGFMILKDSLQDIRPRFGRDAIGNIFRSWAALRPNNKRLLPHHTPEEIAAFRRVLATLITILPEGDDLWKRLSTSWESRLDRLRSLTETTDEKG